MAVIIRKTEATFPGPWLLNIAALKELDEILDEQWSRIDAHSRRGMDASGTSTSSTGDGRTITLTLASGTKVRVQSLREADDDLHCQEHEVTKIEVRVCCGEIRGDLVVPSDKGRSLSLITLPEASEPAVELFVRLNRWAAQNKPDLFRRFCGIGVDGAFFLALFTPLIVLLLLILTGNIREISPWRDKVATMLATGVHDADQSRVLELLLQNAAHLDSQGAVLQVPHWYWPLVGAVFLVSLLLCYPARTVFAIGKGNDGVRRQEGYDRFLRKLIPAFLFLGVLASVLGSFVFEYFR